MAGESYRIAVCDDSAADAGYVRTLVERWAGRRGVAADVETFPSAERFLFRYGEDKAWDILLLDVEMGAMDGVTLARQIRRDSHAVQIVFVTGYTEYIADGYDVEALHYLVKPIDENKLATVLDRAAARLRTDERCIDVHADGGTARVPMRLIRYLDVRGNYVTIHADRDYTAKRSLSDAARDLDDRFVRVGRGLVVNLAAVRRVTRTAVLLDDGTELRLPRGAYETLNRAIIAHG